MFLEATCDQSKFGEDKEVTLLSIIDFVGSTDRKYLPFLDQAVRDVSRSVVYKVLGDLLERLIKGLRIKNNGICLLTLMEPEGKKRNLPWAMKD